MATWSFDIPNRVATVLSPDTTVTVQEIYDTFRDFEDELERLWLPVTVAGSGKDDLGGGVFTVTNVFLQDGWRVAFEARGGPSTEQMTVTDGNLLGFDSNGDPQFPIAPTAFTSVTIAQATTGSILDPGVASLETLRKLLLNRMETNPVTGRMTVYDDDDTTVLVEGDIYEDVAGSQTYRGQGIERRDRLA